MVIDLGNGVAQSMIAGFRRLEPPPVDREYRLTKSALTMAARLFHYSVEGLGAKPFMQIIVVKAMTDASARLAVEAFLRADALKLTAYDEKETAIIDADGIPLGWRKPGNPCDVIAASGRIWCDEDL